MVTKSKEQFEELLDFLRVRAKNEDYDPNQLELQFEEMRTSAGFSDPTVVVPPQETEQFSPQNKGIQRI